MTNGYVIGTLGVSVHTTCRIGSPVAPVARMSTEEYHPREKSGRPKGTKNTYVINTSALDTD